MAGGNDGSWQLCKIGAARHQPGRAASAAAEQQAADVPAPPQRDAKRKAPGGGAAELLPATRRRKACPDPDPHPTRVPYFTPDPCPDPAPEFNPYPYAKPNSNPKPGTQSSPTPAPSEEAAGVRMMIVVSGPPDDKMVSDSSGDGSSSGGGSSEAESGPHSTVCTCCNVCNTCARKLEEVCQVGSCRVVSHVRALSILVAAPGRAHGAARTACIKGGSRCTYMFMPWVCTVTHAATPTAHLRFACRGAEMRTPAVGRPTQARTAGQRPSRTRTAACTCAINAGTR